MSLICYSWVVSFFSKVFSRIPPFIVSSPKNLCLFLDILSSTPLVHSSWSLGPCLSLWLASSPWCPCLCKSKMLYNMTTFTSSYLSYAPTSLYCASKRIILSSLQLVISFLNIVNVFIQSGESTSPHCSIDMSSSHLCFDLSVLCSKFLVLISFCPLTSSYVLSYPQIIVRIIYISATCISSPWYVIISLLM